MPENKKKTRGNLAVMGRLVGLVKPLAPVMVAAVLLGVAGFLCAIFITVLGAYALLDSILPGMPISLGTVCLLLPVLAIARGVLHYAEQGCNHFIAFKLLALIRDKVFGALRRLASAKLEGRDRGDLIAVLTADIELLEVFYAHTISPICIAVIVSAIMAAFLAGYHWLLGLYALGAYLVIGLLVPVAAAKSARRSGEEFRASFGALNGFVLDSLRGVRESLQYGDGPHRLAQINARTDKLSSQERRLKLAGGTAQAVTGGIILLLDAGMLALAAGLAQSGTIGFDGCLIAVVALMSSFGPVIALANCSGVWSCGDTGVVLTFDAFRSTWGFVGLVILCIAVVLFTYSSYLGFFVEFRTCVEYLFGEKAIKFMKWLFLALPIVSVTLEVEQVWDIADMAVGFIVIPNMIALLLLSPKFFEILKDYRAKLAERK